MAADLNTTLSLLQYDPESVPDETKKVIQVQASAVEGYLKEIGVPPEACEKPLYLQTVAIGVNDLQQEQPDAKFSGLFDRLAEVLR